VQPHNEECRFTLPALIENQIYTMTAPEKVDRKTKYDTRYEKGYRSKLEGYEVARRNALSHFFTKGLGEKSTTKGKVLDYGAGNGLFFPLWRQLFPLADIYCCDISMVAREKFIQNYSFHPDHYGLVVNNQIPFTADSFDLIVSIEVMEHVEDLDRFLKEAWRVLKVGGMFVWTTPCANTGSIEHIYSYCSRNVEKTAEGFRRWKWEDPSHIRRLKSGEVKHLLECINFSDIHFRFRSHFFSFICSRLTERKILRQKSAEKMIELDYKFFRLLPNGASMIGLAKK
jgi:ubiquinone/menaquinone biosynthesis C-methylase UbiE